MRFNHFVRCFPNAKPRTFSSKLVRFLFPVMGIIAIVWILVRVIPKPSRATYPCMKMAFPVAASFAAYIGGLVASVYLIKKAGKGIRQKRVALSVSFFVLAVAALVVSLLNEQKTSSASVVAKYNYEDPLGPNRPIGEAKGILPGRVVWVHNPDATNAACKSKTFGDGYFLDKNCDQAVVDKMLCDALLALTGEESEAAAWKATFKYFNKTHGKGEVGYDKNETIFIKINHVHAWSVNSDLSIKNDDNYGNVDTSPQAVLAMLRQLVNVAGVPQQNIYIGDPFTNIFKHCYDKWSAEFPNINYISKYNKPKRYQLIETTEGKIVYSDKGTVLGEKSDAYYSCHVDADYLLNIPAIKAHRWGGVTFFAKNHFGTHTRGGSSHLHPGLHRIDYDQPMREEYNQYRVMVDLMGHKHLGGKTLIYFGDFLWGTSYEHDPPMKFESAPFNNDWSSSILLSFDPVAIESVALDIYQAEIQEEDLTTSPPRYAYVRFGAIDDYLHQAASKDWWPEGIQYDPEGDGTNIGSLGVHEHWNNDQEKKYSRNLGTGEGIELMFISKDGGVGVSNLKNENRNAILCYPNWVDEVTTLQVNNTFLGKVEIAIYDINGKKQKTEVVNKNGIALIHSLNVNDLKPGNYIVEANLQGENLQTRFVKE